MEVSLLDLVPARRVTRNQTRLSEVHRERPMSVRTFDRTYVDVVKGKLKPSANLPNAELPTSFSTTKVVPTPLSNSLVVGNVEDEKVENLICYKRKPKKAKAEDSLSSIISTARDCLAPEVSESKYEGKLGVKRPSLGGFIRKEGFEKKSKSDGKKLQMNSKLSLCHSCNVQVPINCNSQEEHYNSPIHQRKLKVSLLHSFFLSHSLDWVNDGKEYICLSCNKILTVDAQKLLKHVQKYHLERELKISKLNDLLEPNNDNILEVFRSKIWLTDFATRNDELNAQLNVYKKFSSPCILVETGPHPKTICDLRNNVFTQEELLMMKKVANYLEKNGDKITRSEVKDSSVLCGFGMRWTRGNTGWYHHSKEDCLKLSEELAKFVTSKLRKSYEKVFNYLDKIKEMEGFSKEDACIGNSPFTTFTVTRDHNCRPHLDHDDYDLGS